jgi:hypothetical protein
MQNYKTLGNLFLILSLILAISVNQVYLFILIFIIALSNIYSLKPFRLKRFFILSNLILSTIGLSVFLLGGSLINQNVIPQDEQNIMWYIFFGFFVASFLKDYKDTYADKTDGVITLANLYPNSFLFLKIALILFYQFMSYNLLGFDTLLFVAILFMLFFRESEKLLLYIQLIAGLIYLELLI